VQHEEEGLMALAKIRALHPEIFSDDDLCEVSIAARWLYAGLWCYACDNGHLADKPKQIKRWIFASDDVSAADLLRELEDVAEVIERADGWIVIPGLRKRQKVDWRYFKTCDYPGGCEKPAKKTDSQPETRRGPAVDPAGTRRDHATDGDGDGDGVRDGDSDGDVKPSRKRSETPPRFEEFWTVYDHKVGRAKAEAAYRSALRKPGVTEELLISAADAYIAWVKSDGKHPAYTKHPTTWLNGEHWRDERVARQAPMTNTQRHLALARDLAASQQPATLPIGEIQ
jgi:hypothetical protein